jgi:hypothetical protein
MYTLYTTYCAVQYNIINYVRVLCISFKYNALRILTQLRIEQFGFDATDLRTLHLWALFHHWNCSREGGGGEQGEGGGGGGYRFEDRGGRPGIPVRGRIFLLTPPFDVPLSPPLLTPPPLPPPRGGVRPLGGDGGGTWIKIHKIYIQKCFLIPLRSIFTT